MKKTGLFYWPKQGNVETCALKIKDHFDEGSIELYPLDKMDNCDINDFDLIIVGGSTAGADHWENATENNLWTDFFDRYEKSNMKGKAVAIFGLGDQILYPDHFVDGMKIIKDEIDKSGGKLVGRWSTDGYNFTGSDSVEGNKFLGLALDHDHQEDLTDERIEKWVRQIKNETFL
jgi:flavodoxin I